MKKQIIYHHRVELAAWVVKERRGVLRPAKRGLKTFHELGNLDLGDVGHGEMGAIAERAWEGWFNFQNVIIRHVGAGSSLATSDCNPFLQTPRNFISNLSPGVLSNPARLFFDRNSPECTPGMSSLFLDKSLPNISPNPGLMVYDSGEEKWGDYFDFDIPSSPRHPHNTANIEERSISSASLAHHAAIFPHPSATFLNDPAASGNASAGFNLPPAAISPNLTFKPSSPQGMRSSGLPQQHQYTGPPSFSPQEIIIDWALRTSTGHGLVKLSSLCGCKEISSVQPTAGGGWYSSFPFGLVLTFCRCPSPPPSVFSFGSGRFVFVFLVCLIVDRYQNTLTVFNNPQAFMASPTADSTPLHRSSFYICQPE